jgi:hypothetical protein
MVPESDYVAGEWITNHRKDGNLVYTGSYFYPPWKILMTDLSTREVLDTYPSKTTSVPIRPETVENSNSYLFLSEYTNKIEMFPVYKGIGTGTTYRSTVFADYDELNINQRDRIYTNGESHILVTRSINMTNVHAFGM